MKMVMDGFENVDISSWEPSEPDPTHCPKCSSTKIMLHRTMFLGASKVDTIICLDCGKFSDPTEPDEIEYSKIKPEACPHCNSTHIYLGMRDSKLGTVCWHCSDCNGIIDEICTNCNSIRVTWSTKYNRFYCNNCRTYYAITKAVKLQRKETVPGAPAAPYPFGRRLEV